MLHIFIHCCKFMGCTGCGTDVYMCKLCIMGGGTVQISETYIYSGCNCNCLWIALKLVLCGVLIGSKSVQNLLFVAPI